jgi:transposase
LSTAGRVPLGVDNLDGEQLRQAAKLLERENERLIRQVLELKQQLATAEGKGSEQLEFLAELERQLANRNRKLFGDSSEKRASSKPDREARPQAGHGPREQPELAVIEREHVLDEADHVCPSCGGRLAEMTGQSEDSEEVDVLERQFVLVRHKRKKYRCSCGGCVETLWGRRSSFRAGVTRLTSQ